MDKRAQMEAAIQKWRGSGQKKKDFCQQEGITLSTFGYWITRINQSQRKGFVPIPATGQTHASTVEVIYPNGVRIKAAAGDLKTISQLISLC